MRPKFGSGLHGSKENFPFTADVNLLTAADAHVRAPSHPPYDPPPPPRTTPGRCHWACPPDAIHTAIFCSACGPACPRTPSFVGACAGVAGGEGGGAGYVTVCVEGAAALLYEGEAGGHGCPGPGGEGWYVCVCVCGSGPHRNQRTVRADEHKSPNGRNSNGVAYHTTHSDGAPHSDAAKEPPGPRTVP